MSKDVAYDANNNVSNLVYQTQTTATQGQEWVVSFGCYKVVGDNVFICSQETIFAPRIATYVVKATIVGGNIMEDIDGLNTDLQPFDISLSSVFIDLFSLSFGEDMPSQLQGFEV